jgi:hypothetical protein
VVRSWCGTGFLNPKLMAEKIAAADRFIPL